MVHIEFQKGNQLHRRAAHLILEKHKRIHQERLQLNSVTRAHHATYNDWMQVATFCGLRHWNFHLLSFWLTFGVAVWRQSRNNEWEVFIRTSRLLHSVHHRAMITPVVLCLLGSFILAQVTGQFFVRLKLFSNRNCPLQGSQNLFVQGPHKLLHKSPRPEHITKSTSFD